VSLISPVATLGRERPSMAVKVGIGMVKSVCEGGGSGGKEQERGSQIE
jgi:hypothetical protein